MITDLERTLANMVHRAVLMRRAQAAYFHSRSSADLDNARTHERAFDTLASALLSNMREDHKWTPGT
jgi:hypothetical protein